MSATKTTLKEAMGARGATATAEAPKPPAAQEEERGGEAPKKRRTPNYRVGTRNITIHVDPAVLMQVKRLGLQLGDRKTQSMMLEALDDFFSKHGLPRIASAGKPPPAEASATGGLPAPPL